MTHAALPLLHALRPLLRTERFGRRAESYVALGSTNTRALAWAAEGAAEGSLVVAERQTAGRGRYGRAWQAKAGKNLTCSLVLRPRLAPERLGLVTLAAGVAVAEAVSTFAAPLAPAIKWPNDVLMEGRKCCGMLLESSFVGRAENRPPAVILGIGLNVNQAAFPSDLAADASHPPTSLLLETGRHVPRAALLAELLRVLEDRYQSLFEDGGRAVRRAYVKRMAGLGEVTTLRFTGTERRVEGRLDGISAIGALRLQTADGLLTLHAGEVTSR